MVAHPHLDDGVTVSQQPVALITGTSSGIGLSLAVRAALAGIRVVATLRDTARAIGLAAAAAEAGVERDIRALDVTDDAATTAVVDAVVADHGRLDILVNNAGAGHVGTVELDTVDDFRASMEVNFFGVVRMTKAAMPALRAAGGRLITVSSVGGVIGQPFNEAYCAAKFAVEGMMESLAPVAAQQATEFVANAGVDIARVVTSAGPYAATLAGYLERASGSFTAAQTPDEVAAVVLGAMTAEHPPFRVQTSDWATGFVGTKLADLDGSSVQGLTSAWLGAPA
jgi:NAD(P)-dependent dehydrogenase (short-subunit alcohol dehydrogenase family)